VLLRGGSFDSIGQNWTTHYNPGALGPGIAHCACRVENLPYVRTFVPARMPAHSKVADAFNDHLEHLNWEGRRERD
jgi:hypothetical protein